MIFNKIWQRHIISRFALFFFGCITAFLSLYVMIDLPNRLNTFQSLNLSTLQIAFFYLCVFVQRFDLLVPFSAMVATIAVLSKMQIRNELVALHSAGISKQKLIHPLIACALFLTVFLYINNLFLLPKAQPCMNHYLSRESSFLKLEKTKIRSLTLDDDSVVIFHHYDQNEKKLIDVWWIQNPNQFYHFDTLSPFTNPPLGTYVDLYKKEGSWIEKTSSKPSQTLPQFKISESPLKIATIPPKELSLSELLKRLPQPHMKMHYYEAEALTTLLRMLLIPWIALFVVILPTPFCLQFSRNYTPFYLFAGSIVLLICSYLTLNAATIAAEGLVVSPLIALGLPFLLLSSLSLWTYLRLGGK